MCVPWIILCVSSYQEALGVWLSGKWHARAQFPDQKQWSNMTKFFFSQQQDNDASRKLRELNIFKMKRFHATRSTYFQKIVLLQQPYWPLYILWMFNKT